MGDEWNFEMEWEMHLLSVRHSAYKAVRSLENLLQAK